MKLQAAIASILLIASSISAPASAYQLSSRSALDSCYENLSGEALKNCVDRVTSPQGGGQRVSPRGSGRIVAQLSDTAIEEQCRYMALYQGQSYSLCIENWKRANS